MELVIKVVTVGNWKLNCYFVSSEDEGWLIDPGDDFELINSYFNLNKYKIKGIINTHGHFDNIGAIHDIKEMYNIPFLIHSKDKRLINQGNLYRRMAGGIDVRKTPVIDDYLDNVTYLELKDNRIMIHHTPGHTSGSVCFEINGNLFTGDLLFEDNVGRTDLPGGNKEHLVASINFLFEKFKGSRVHPGHGESFILDDNMIRYLKTML